MSITRPEPVPIYPFLKNCNLILKAHKKRKPTANLHPKAHYPTNLHPNLLSANCYSLISTESPDLLFSFSRPPSPISTLQFSTVLILESSSPLQVSNLLLSDSHRSNLLLDSNLSLLESQTLISVSLPSATQGRLWLDLRFFLSTRGCSLVSRR